MRPLLKDLFRTKDESERWIWLHLIRIMQVWSVCNVSANTTSCVCYKDSVASEENAPNLINQFGLHGLYSIFIWEWALSFSLRAGITNFTFRWSLRLAYIGWRLLIDLLHTKKKSKSRGEIRELLQCTAWAGGEELKLEHRKSIQATK